MNRETESHFSNIPYIEKDRSKFKRPFTNKTTWNAGDLIPIYVDSDILPGDTVSMDMGSVVRMSTPIYPVMDNCNMDVFFFFVPHRLVWEHWREFWGENRSTYWEQPVEYEIPQIEAPATTGWDSLSLADYMGLPTKLTGISVNHLPFRAYCQIVNDWFRDQNLKDPCFFNTDETTLTGINKGVNYDYTTDIQLGAAPYKAAKYHDYFTSALPEPQKGPDVTIPLGLTAEIKTGPRYGHVDATGEGLKWADVAGAPLDSTTYDLGIGGTAHGTVPYTSTPAGSASTYAHPDNLYADLQNATAATINQLRQAFAIQRFYEAQARGGSRYVEFIKNIFGVSSPDGRQQRAEYLGGYRCPINVTQVLQTSSTDSTSPLGGTGAFSYTPDQESVFTHSFTEHGTLMGLAVIRTDHTYQQGIERMWSRKKWTDFYVPQFANLGEQAILNKEIYAQGTSTDNEAFGYQEAWADYRYKPSIVTGAFRSNYTGSLDSWHYADDYSSQPYLSSDWIDETDANVARTLSVQNEPQFIGDFYFDATYTRIMPVYSVPGLLDHH